MTEAQTQHFARAILEMLEETLDTHHGYYLDAGDSMFPTLAGISAEEASRPISPSCASIAAQVNHTAYYLDVLRQDLDLEHTMAEVNWQQSWTIDPVSDEEWTALVKRLRDSANAVRSAIEQVDAWDEDEAYSAVAIAMHTAYHLGQIRQALCMLSART